MSISNWPKDDRPREKLLIKGERVLSDAELIALFLQTGTRGRSAVDIAKDLLQEFGDIKKLFRAPKHRILQRSGIGAAKYARLKAAIELARRYNCDDIKPGMALNNSQLTQRFLIANLREHSKEVFACVFLTNHFQLLAYEELFYGTINETSIYPREIVKRGLAHNAAKIILAHNHPSGQPAPSVADIEMTTVIKNALALVDIEVVDHVIIGNPNNYSFAENGIDF